MGGGQNFFQKIVWSVQWCRDAGWGTWTVCSWYPREVQTSRRTQTHLFLSRKRGEGGNSLPSFSSLDNRRLQLVFHPHFGQSRSGLSDRRRGLKRRRSFWRILRFGRLWWGRAGTGTSGEYSRSGRRLFLLRLSGRTLCLQLGEEHGSSPWLTRNQTCLNVALDDGQDS